MQGDDTARTLARAAQGAAAAAEHGFDGRFAAPLAPFHGYSTAQFTELRNDFAPFVCEALVRAAHEAGVCSDTAFRVGGPADADALAMLNTVNPVVRARALRLADVRHLPPR